MSNQNTYWALSLGERYTEEVQLSTIKTLMANLHSYLHVMTVSGDIRLVAFVLNEISTQSPRPDTYGFIYMSPSRETLKMFIDNIEEYSIIVHGEQDESVYVIVRTEYVDDFLNMLNN